MLESLPIILIVGTVLGFLSGLGIGGGSLLILWLTMVLHTDPLVSRSINLLFFIPSALVACALRIRQGNHQVGGFVLCGHGLHSLSGLTFGHATHIHTGDRHTVHDPVIIGIGGTAAETNSQAAQKNGNGQENADCICLFQYSVLQCSRVISPEPFFFKISIAFLISSIVLIPVDKIIFFPVLAIFSK